MPNRIRVVVLLSCLLALVPSAAFAQRANAIMLNGGFMPDPHNEFGVSGGPVEADNVDQSCRGWISARPTFVLFTQSGFQFLRVFIQSQVDTTLMVRNQNGTQTWCNDDTYGLNPGLDLTQLPPGRYEIYVGSYSNGSSGPFRIGFSESPQVTPDTPTGPPNQRLPQGYYAPPANNGPQQYVYNNNNPNSGYQQPPPGNNSNQYILPPNSGPQQPNPLVPDSAPVGNRIALPAHVTAPHFQMGHTEGRVSVASVPGQGACVGFTSPGPSYVIDLAAAQPFLRLFVTSAANTGLVVRYPDGTYHCNDDSYNTPHPSVEGAFPAGTYQVWVSVDQANMNRPFRLTITADPRQHP